MAGGNQKPLKFFFGKCKSHNRGTVAGNIVFALWLQLPAFMLMELLEALLLQLLANGLDGMEGAGAFLDKIK